MSKGKKKKEVALWNTDIIEYGTLTFSRDEIGRWTPIISVYTFIDPIGDALKDYDNKIGHYKHKELWLAEPEDTSDLDCITKWDMEVDGLISAFFAACEEPLSWHWYDAKYFNGGKLLLMTFSQLQQETLRRPETHDKMVQRLEKIIRQEKIERSCDMDEWLTTATVKKST